MSGEKCLIFPILFENIILDLYHYTCAFTTTMEQFKIIQPSAILAPYVKHYWLLKSHDITHSQRIIPTGNMSLIFHRGCSIENTLLRIHTHGGKTLRPKTKIQADGLGYFAQFADSEGNTLGLYSEL